MEGSEDEENEDEAEDEKPALTARRRGGCGLWLL